MTEENVNNATKQARKIAALNDLCRKAMGIAGRLVQTSGISALPMVDQSAIRERVEIFDTFTPDNDPHGEHDFGAFEHKSERIFWKIDYYNPTMTYGSEDPSRTGRSGRYIEKVKKIASVNNPEIAEHVASL